MKCLLMGSGGREAIIGEKLAEKFELFVVMGHKNPSLVEFTKKTGGKYLVDKSFSKENIERFIKDNKIEYCVVNSDNLLQDGMIDLAKKCGLKTFGPTRKAARIEWDKEFALEIVKKVAPEAFVKSYLIHEAETLEKVSTYYENEKFVVKPNGLTAGKGVKVGGEHFLTKKDGIDYAKECLEKDGVVIIQDKIEGHEFTIMGFTDGKNIVFAPTTYDYPYRYDNDKGPGTGGMGCVTFSDGLLPFLNKEDLEKCKRIMQDSLNELNKENKEFNGVLYGSFFKTEKEILFMEYNSRLGDPEAINVLSVLETPFADIVCTVADEKELNENNCKFKKTNSYIVYVVSKGYAVESKFLPIKFSLDERVFKENVKIYFASAEKIKDEKYVSTGNSRLLGFSNIGDDFLKLKKQVDNLLEQYILDDTLEYRKDIGTTI